MVSVQVFSTIVAVALLAHSCAGIGLLNGLGLYGGNFYGGGLNGFGFGGLGCGCRCLSPCLPRCLPNGLVNTRLSVSKLPTPCGLGCGLPPSSCCLNVIKPSICKKLLCLKQKLLAKKLGLLAGLGCGCGCF